MKTVGLICEFNPFHTGHDALLRRIRERYGQDCGILCVMSGDFVQRGEPAIFGKYVRANAAVACGADLVVELPLPRSLSSAEGFARGGVEILRRCGAETLAFGCECGDGAGLMSAAAATRDPAFDEITREYLRQGVSYAAARQSAAARLGAREDLFRSPNDILGIEYCRAVAETGDLDVFAVPRPGDYHATEADPDHPSATAVREKILSGGWEPFVPAGAGEIFASAPRHAMSFGQRAVLARLRAMTESEWERAAHGSEGLWRKAREAVWSQPDLEGILRQTKSKRYPMTRLNRLILCAYLGVTEEMLHEPVSGCRILAFSDRGRDLIRRCRDRGELALYNPGEAAPDEERRRVWADLYGLFSENLSDDPPGAEKRARISPKNEITLI